MSEEALGVTQDVRPCEIHATHSPITIINELHHVYPQFLQRRLWGEVRDETLISLCATGHNTVHYAINHWLKNGEYPRSVIGRTRDLVESAVNWYANELKESDDTSTP